MWRTPHLWRPAPRRATALGLPWDAALTSRADEGRLLVDVTSAQVAGVQMAGDALPAALRTVLTGLDVPVSGPPTGLTATGARVVLDGVAVTATGHDVVLPATDPAHRLHPHRPTTHRRSTRSAAACSSGVSHSPYAALTRS